VDYRQTSSSPALKPDVSARWFQLRVDQLRAAQGDGKRRHLAIAFSRPGHATASDQ
jgi:hypothetical protein